MTRKQLEKYIEEYNRTNEGKCIPTWEESVYYVLVVDHIFYPAKETNTITNSHINISTNYYTNDIRKFKTKEEAEQYIKDNKDEHYSVKLVDYDSIKKEGFLIPEKFYA